MRRICNSQKNMNILSIALTLLVISGILSGCTQVNRPASQSMEPPSTGRAMVRGGEEPAMAPRTMTEHMNQCQDMMKQSLNNPNVPYDKQYIDTMIRHHQGAIQMAQDAKLKAQHPEVKQLSQNIIDTQQKEIEKLKDWRQQWYGKEPQKSVKR